MAPSPPAQPHQPANEQSLIADSSPVERSLFRRRTVLRPGLAAVYSTADGRVENLGRLISWSETISGRYTRLYEVVIALRTSTISTNHDLRTKDDRFSFTVSAKIGWRVREPDAVVREQFWFGDRTVVDYVFDLMRPIARRYEIRQCELAEREINELKGQMPIRLSKVGIAVESISARLSLDETTAQFLQQQTQIGYHLDLQKRTHQLDVDKQQNEQQLESARLHAVADGVQGEFGLITMHLMQHPGESLNVLNLLHERQRELEQQQTARFSDSRDMFMKMLSSGEFNNADLEAFREMLLRDITAGSGVALTAPATRGPTQTLSALASPVADGSPQPAPIASTPTTPPQANPSGVAGWKQRKPPRSEP